MDADSLTIFCAVAAELSITRAASRLGRAPSNVSTRIQNLEAGLGAELFVRSGKRMHLSSAGTHFLGYARRLLALQEEARQAVAGDGPGAVLRIGSMESTAASRLPAPLAAFCRAHPAIRLEVATGTSQALLEGVRDGRHDCALVALLPGLDDAASLAGVGLQAQPVWREDLLLLLPPNEAATTPDAVRHRVLAVFRQGCAYRAVAEEALAVAGRPDWFRHEVGSYHAMVAAVAAGACVALLPRSVLDLAPLPAGLRTLPVRSLATWLVSRRGYAAPAFEAFRQGLAQEGRP